VIVFGEHETTIETREALAALRRRCAALDGAAIGEWRDALVDFGELESAILDGRRSPRDDEDELSRALADVSLALAAGFYDVVTRQRSPADVNTIEALLDRIEGAAVPRAVRLRTAEAYAHRAVYPEMYIQAASDFALTVRPARVLCVGLRTIGTSASAVVAAALSAHGVRVERVTVRPRGNALDRRLALTERLEAHLNEASGAAVGAIVGEGDGLGPAFAAAARALGDMGVPDERIVLFPSRPAEPRLALEAASARHRRYLVSFDFLFVRTGRLAQIVGAPRLLDLSAGRWRRLFFTEDAAPATHPLHERRKYLFHAPRARRPRLLARFAGLGRTGRARYDRALRLAASGWGPAPVGLRDGFLVLPFVEGRPLAANVAGPPLLGAMVRYLTRVRRGFAAPRTFSVDALLHMIDVNAAEAGLAPGRDAMRRVAAAANESALVEAVGVDGRMLPHEWLATAGGFAKVDALDHHDDVFFPGVSDPAWDLAGALVEFEWPNGGGAALLAAYARSTNDRGLDTRLPFQLAAYLAFRLGYCRRAAAALEDTAEGARFAALARRYRAALAARLDARVSAPHVDTRGARTVP
jgi:hypothetical protein